MIGSRTFGIPAAMASAAQLAAHEADTTNVHGFANTANVLQATIADAKGDLIAGTAADTVARLAVGADGQSLIADSSQTAGLRWGAVGIESENMAVGEFVPPRSRLGSNAIGYASGTLVLSYFTAHKSETITTLTAYSGATAAAATPTLCRMGIYSVAGNGNLTLVASTPNDTTLFATINTAYAKALSVSWAKVAGTRYATALLVVSGATMPTFHGVQLAATGPANTFVREDPAIIGRVLSQTDLPASITVGSIVGLQSHTAMKLS